MHPCLLRQDDILIFSHNEAKHDDHVCLVFERLAQN